MSREDRNALLTAKRVCDAVIAVVNLMPTGAPAEPMYAALMPYLSLAQFESMMRLLVETGRVTKRGDLYFPAAKAGA
jgi:uncharacterized membrane protein YozB (DUF420 family)